MASTRREVNPPPRMVFADQRREVVGAPPRDGHPADADLHLGGVRLVDHDHPPRAARGGAEVVGGMAVAGASAPRRRSASSTVAPGSTGPVDHQQRRPGPEPALVEGHRVPAPHPRQVPAAPLHRMAVGVAAVDRLEERPVGDRSRPRPRRGPARPARCRRSRSNSARGKVGRVTTARQDLEEPRKHLDRRREPVDRGVLLGSAAQVRAERLDEVVDGPAGAASGAAARARDATRCARPKAPAGSSAEPARTSRRAAASGTPGRRADHDAQAAPRAGPRGARAGRRRSSPWPPAPARPRSGCAGVEPFPGRPPHVRRA